MNIFIYDEAIYPIIIRQNIPWREKGGVKKTRIFNSQADCKGLPPHPLDGLLFIIFSS